jgi:lipopolysaccharide/colanic/teichoic acid biosynthesis glycosyltransferase
MSMLTITTMERPREAQASAAPESQEIGAADAPPAAMRNFRRWLPSWPLVLLSCFRPFNYALLKRLIDVVGSAVLLILLLPLFAVVAALIKLSDGGPVLFWQIRVGRRGRTFAMPKFRSMVRDAERLLPTLLWQNDHRDGVVFKMKADPRVTWIGWLIRRVSIDELPQLWCVLKGDMSLVGPRPPVPHEVARYSERDFRRLDVLPGLTCIWQVSGRSLIPFPIQVNMDIEYVEKQSLWLDLKLIFQTIPAILFQKGAY